MLCVTFKARLGIERLWVQKPGLGSKLSTTVLSRQLGWCAQSGDDRARGKKGMLSLKNPYQQEDVQAKITFI